MDPARGKVMDTHKKKQETDMGKKNRTVLGVTLLVGACCSAIGGYAYWSMSAKKRNDVLHGKFDGGDEEFGSSAKETLSYQYPPSVEFPQKIGTWILNHTAFDEQGEHPYYKAFYGLGSREVEAFWDLNPSTSMRKWLFFETVGEGSEPDEDEEVERQPEELGDLGKAKFWTET